MLCVVNVQHTHDDAFGLQVPAKQIGGSHRGSWEVHTNCVHDLGRMQAMQRHRQPFQGRGGRAWRDGGV